MLLLQRITVFESGMFEKIKHEAVKKGNFFMFFTNGQRFKKYFLAILIGLPTWYVIGILVSFSKEFGEKFGIAEPIESGKAVMLAYVAIAIGDVLIGFVSQALKSRKKALFIFYGLTIIGMVLYFRQDGGSADNMYLICAFLGFSTGFWAIFVTMAAEHFGTNLRATAATTVPNMVRGALPLMTMLFKGLQSNGYSYINSAAITGAVVMGITLIAAFFTEETFGKDLNFLEH
jgi:hypothetical protein